jgi:hypothetical protein
MKEEKEFNCKSVLIEVIKYEDYEILQSNQERIEENLLNQIFVLYRVN